MTAWIKDILDSPRTERLLKQCGITVVVLIVLFMLGWGGKEILSIHRASVETLQTQSVKIADTQTKLVEVQSEIKSDGDRTNQAVEKIAADQVRIAEAQERTTKALERLVPQAITKAD